NWNGTMTKESKLILVVAFLFASCDHYFGNKTDIGFIEVPEFQTREVAYVPIQPQWDYFKSPSDIITGFDELFYVVDRMEQRVYSLDESGKILGSIGVPGVKKVVQDRQFDLLALGTKRATINGVEYDLACI